MAVSNATRTRARKNAKTTAGSTANGRAKGRQATPEALKLDDDQLIAMYRKMVLIRRFEEKCAEAYAYGKIGGFCHLYIGQEAVAVGSIAALRDDDHIVTHYRDHGYALARGCDPGATMAELYGRATGLSGGRGGSMHLADVEKHFWGGYAIVAGHLPLAVGIAQAIKYRDDDQVVVGYFGDGSTNNGTFHEAMNMAAVWDLPVIFLAENNQYGMGTAIDTASRVTELVEKAVAHAMPAEQVDGMDVLAMYEATARLAARCRAGEGPFFLEAKTYRLVGHSVADPAGYRTREEVEQYRTGEPIVRFAKLLEERGALSAEDAQRLDREASAAADEAAKFADDSAEPAPDTLFEHVYAAPLGQD